MVYSYHLSNPTFRIMCIVEPEPIGCSSDFECASNQACRDRSCINPCTSDKPCSPSAICSVRNHKATCTCPPGFDGDPYRQCNKSKKLYSITHYDNLLKSFYRCTYHNVNSTIQIIISVKIGECQHDIECPDSKACIENQCLDPCDLTEPCGKQAVCRTTSHRPVCRCPSNWAGNPHDECYQCMFLYYR